MLETNPILSVNDSLVRELLSDRGFLCSHLTPYLTSLSSNEISGQPIEPYLVGKLLTTYETIGQGMPLHLVSATVDALDSLLANSDFLRTRKCLQSVLSTEVATRPIVGLPAVITLDRLARLDVSPELKGNVLTDTLSDSNEDCALSVPTYISYNDNDYCADKTDVDIEFDYGVDNNDSALYIPYCAFATPYYNTDFSKDCYKHDWVYRLINHYTQAHYKLVLACSHAQKRPYAFGLIVSIMLGFKLSNLDSYNVDDYLSQTYLQKYDYITIIKPLIEHIAYDFLDGTLISL